MSRSAFEHCGVEPGAGRDQRATGVEREPVGTQPTLEGASTTGDEEVGSLAFSQPEAGEQLRLDRLVCRAARRPGKLGAESV